MSVIMIVGWTLILGACAFAWWKGGPAERWGSLLNVAASVCGVAVRLLPADSRQSGMLVADGMLAFGLLILAVRYTNLWIGAAMLLQAVQFGLHTYYFVLEQRHDPLFAVVNNVVVLGIFLCLVGGTLVTWRRGGQTAAMA